MPPSWVLGAQLVINLVVAAAAVLGIGLWVAAIARTAQAAAAIGNILFFPMMFFAGLWIPRIAMPAVVRTLSDFTPLGAGYAAVSGIAAVKYFKWE